MEDSRHLVGRRKRPYSFSMPPSISGVSPSGILPSLVYPGAWTTVLVSPENVSVWNVRTENLDTWSVRQEMYVRVVNPEANGKIELPIPDNALYCGLM